jgi:hypothetical protein
MTVDGFPNLFVMYGPNTNLGAGSIVEMLEAQAGYIARCVDHLARTSARWLDVRPEVLAEYHAEIRERSRQSPFEAGCRSWYVDEHGRNMNNWIGSVAEYQRRTARPNFAEFEVCPGGVSSNP